MMSSGEETEYFAPYGASTESKQQRFQKKQKRTRQRVDAGEPRNNYSSIPHFTSRPSFHGGGLYGSIFGSSGPTLPQQQSQQPLHQSQQGQQPQQQQQQQQQQLQQQQAGAASSQGHLGTATTGPSAQQHSAHATFGFFGAPGYGPANMLNELLGRQVKQASDAGGSPPEGGHGMTGAGMDPAANLQSGAVVNCDDPATAELTQHMLRDILQGRKISALSIQEQPNNNNSIHSNNNNTTADLLKSQQQHRQSPQQHQQNSDSARSGTVQSGGEESGDGNNLVNNANHSDRDNVMPGDAEDSADDAAAAARAMEEAFAEAGMDPGANLDGSDCEQSLPPSPTQPKSGSVSVKEEIQDSLNRTRSPSHSPCPIVPKTEANSPTTETKRARVENIVSTMRSSPALQTPTVNGCKKRKLYQPQQQTVNLALQHGANDVTMDDEEESEEEEDPSTIRQRRLFNEKDNLQIQLKNLHEQLAVMQQKYNELTSRMDSDASESIGAPLSPQPPLKPPRPHPPPYNGLPSLPTEHPHAAAAAMYHMGHKLYLEQQQAALERMKQHQEAAVRQQQQQQQQQHQHQHQQQQQQQQHQRPSSPPPPPSQPQQQSQSNTGPSTPQTPQMQAASTPLQHKEFQERINVFRGATSAASSSGPHITDEDLQSLSDTLKAEITSYLTNLIDKVVTRFVQQRRFLGKQSEAAQVAAEQLNKDLMLASQILERKSPRTKVVDRGAPQPPGGPNGPRGPHNGGPPPPQPTGFQQFGSMGGGPHGPHSGPTENNLNQMNLSHVARGTMFQTPKPPSIYSMASMQAQQQQQQQQHQQQREHQQREQQQRDQYCNLRNDDRESRDSEQNEALSLVMTPKKKRHKVTDTRITPRTMSRILAQKGSGPQAGSESPPPPPPRTYHAPPPMLPVSLPTSVAIPNPSLHESQVFSPYSPFFNPHASHPGQVPPPGPHHLPASPPSGGVEVRDSPPLSHPPSILHPALLAAAQHGSPDYGHLRMDSNDRPNDCNSGDISYDGFQPISSMLTPVHLKKAKLMFFWVRYPSSSILKMYFPDVKFNKNNTAQLVKWFSNFREFYYIQMEKYARQAVTEGVKNADDLRICGDSEICRVLNLHYNRNNNIEVPNNFRYVVEQTLREFFKAIQSGKDTEQSWKKSIYKVISRLDDPVPEYFKTQEFQQQLG